MKRDALVATRIGALPHSRQNGPRVYGWRLNDLVELGEMSGTERRKALADRGVKSAAVVLRYSNPLLLGSTGLVAGVTLAAAIRDSKLVSSETASSILIGYAAALVAYLVLVTAAMLVDKRARQGFWSWLD